MISVNLIMNWPVQVTDEAVDLRRPVRIGRFANGVMFLAQTSGCHPDLLLYRSYTDLDGWCQNRQAHYFEY